MVILDFKNAAEGLACFGVKSKTSFKIQSVFSKLLASKDVNFMVHNPPLSFKKCKQLQGQAFMLIV